MMAKIEAPRMFVHRTILAAFLGVVVALAPVASALAVSHAPTGQAMEDCHGQVSNEHNCCDPQAKCPDSCGVSCCKLMGMISDLLVIDRPSVLSLQVVEPLQLPDWQLRPRPPPPRS